MFMIDPVFDRYMIVVLPGVALRTVPRRAPGSRPRWWLGLAGLGLLAAGSVALMHDWLTWNAARWELGRRAVVRGVDPRDIEGGMEWNGSHASRIRKPTGIGFPKKGLAIGFTRDVFPDVTAQYAFDLVGWGWGFPPTERPPTTVVDALDYRLWLTPKPQRMELVRVP
jgi:hypothetical protein